MLERKYIDQTVCAELHHDEWGVRGRRKLVVGQLWDGLIVAQILGVKRR